MAGLILGGCGATVNKGSSITNKKGIVKTKTEDGYVFISNGETMVITSNKINLNNYLNKIIEIKGMYSGSTLYVDEVKESGN